MSVPPGYKQTEAGVIPTDWRAAQLGEVLERCTSGATPYRGRPDYYKGSVPWVSSGELNYNVITDTIEHVSASAVRDANLRLHPPGTFLMAITGLEAAGTRGACAVLGISATTNQSCMALYPTAALSTDYLFHWYRHNGDALALQYCQGTKQQSYTARIVRLLPIPLPPLSEQQAIAQALADADAYIQSLHTLAAKKRRLRDAALHDLLTGATRLPGFGGEWEHKAMGSFGDTYGGLTGKSKRHFGIGSAHYVPFLNVITNTVLDNRKIERVDVGPGETQNKVEQGDLLLNGSSETPEEVALASYVSSDLGTVYLNSFCFGFRPFSNTQVSGLYLAYLNRSKVGRELVKPLAQGATRYNISKRGFLALQIPLPPLPEQQAIASILSDMDADLATLDERIAKVQLLKSAMMDDLLTGRVRLT